MNIDIIAAARPNFIKLAPIYNSIKNEDTVLKVRLIHTGQHYDFNMSGAFFEQLKIPKPDINLGVQGGGNIEQISSCMREYGKILSKVKPDLCIVVGDVNATIACALAAKLNGIKVAHVEAGLRSGDLSMPEEINRIGTDALSDIFFTTTEGASKNLIKENKDLNDIHLVGNVMIDSLRIYENNINNSDVSSVVDITERYCILTVHRLANSNPAFLRALIKSVKKTSKFLKVIFPVHPRNRKIIDDIASDSSNIIRTDPLPYFEFNKLVKNAEFVITDSGGLSEEASYHSIPCITLRSTTERPETVNLGSNRLVGHDFGMLESEVTKILKKDLQEVSRIHEIWDGYAADRIVNIIKKALL